MSILNAESAERSRVDGPCLTIVEVPSVLDGIFVTDIVKVFGPPVTHEREKVSHNVELYYPKTHMIR